MSDRPIFSNVTMAIKRYRSLYYRIGTPSKTSPGYSKNSVFVLPVFAKNCGFLPEAEVSFAVQLFDIQLFSL